MTRVLRAGKPKCAYTYIRTYIYTCMYVCIYMHMHTCMHIHTHTETYLYFTYHIHTPQALMYIYVHTFMYVCVCFCNIIEYTRQGYIHACYMCSVKPCGLSVRVCVQMRHSTHACVGVAGGCIHICICLHKHICAAMTPQQCSAA